MAGGLTPMQLTFVNEYLVDSNGVRASRAAGYKGGEDTLAVNASRLLRSAKVQAAIRGKLRDTEERLNLTRDDVLTGLWHEATFKQDGASHAARVSAWMGIARMQGYVVERSEHKSLTLSANIPALEGMSVAELKELLRKPEIVEGEYKVLPSGEDADDDTSA